MTDDWTVRLQAALAVHKRRQLIRQMARAELAAARGYGLKSRHSQKLRRARGGTEREERT